MLKKVYYQNVLHTHQNNPKEMWKIINEVAGKSITNQLIKDKIKKNNDTILNDDISISNEFNNFFYYNVGKNIENNILNKEHEKIS